MKQIILDVKKNIKYILYASKAQLKSEVAESKLNWIWWILEPMAMMLIYAFVFGVIFNSADSYRGLFIFVGLSIWQFFTRIAKGSVVIVKKNKQIIGKVYMPKYMLILQSVFVNGFKMGICLLISFTLVAYYRVGVTLQILWLIPLLIIITIFTFGISCFMLHFGVFYKDLHNITDIVFRFLIYFVGVFYTISSRLPFPYSDWVVRWNPMAFFIDCVRRVFIYHTPIDFWTLGFYTILSLVLAYTGIQLIYKNENSYVKVV